MNRLLKMAHDLWIEAQLSTPLPVRRAALPLVNDLAQLARLVARPSLPIVELSGEGVDGDLTALFVNARPVQARLESLLFRSEPARRLVGQIPFWRLHEIDAWPSGDIIVANGNKHLIRRLPRANALVLPDFVHHYLDVSGGWNAVRGRIHRGLLTTELRRAQKYGYGIEISHDDQDFDEFYREMYLPTTRSRHGGLSGPMPRGQAHRYFRHGLLLRITRDGRWVAGAVCQIEGDALVGHVLGVRDGDPRLIKEGVVYALYYEHMRWANEHGFRTIDLGEAETYLAWGLFQYKRRWGSTLGVPKTSRRQTWVKVRRLTPSTRSFLKTNPLIVTDERERLYGLIAVDDPARVTAEMRQDLEKHYATPGLESLIVRSVESYVSTERRDLVLPVSAAAIHAYA